MRVFFAVGSLRCHLEMVTTQVVCCPKNQFGWVVICRVRARREGVSLSSAAEVRANVVQTIFWEIFLKNGKRGFAIQNYIFSFAARKTRDRLA